MVLKTFLRIRSLHLILFFLLSCATNRENSGSVATIIWKNEKAIAVSMPNEGLQTESLSIHLTGDKEAPPILGNFVSGDDSVRFEPLIPFTRGLSYEIRQKNTPFATIAIPLADDSNAPSLVAVYPSQDTLPQNVLKFYLHFDKPMREGQSLQHVFVLRENKDTAKQVFLNLQPELWNEQGTVLTLWLDPGRIKRDLQPNKAMGEPLKQNEKYQFTVNKTWTDIHGTPLKESITKEFFVSSPDNISPSPEKWTLDIPTANSKEPIRITFPEPLDHALIMEAISVVDSNSKSVEMTVEAGNEEGTLILFPTDHWKAGKYKIAIEGRLEDLAGNNLNRPFDYDNQGKALKPRQDMFFRSFEIRQ